MALNVAQSLRDKLASSTDVTALVSSTKIAPHTIPEDEVLPAITYSRISEVPHHAFQRDSAVRDPIFQVSSWSTSYGQVIQVANAVKAALRDFIGVLSTSGVSVQRIFLDDEIDFYQMEPGTMSGIFHVAQDYRIIYTT